VELERLNGFPDAWTDSGMTQVQRAFCMGNALVVGIVTRIAKTIAKDSRPKTPLVPLVRQKKSRRS
jgi:DNA (cytosine-5)-methyltransferase 1